MRTAKAEVLGPDGEGKVWLSLSDGPDNETFEVPPDLAALLLKWRDRKTMPDID